MQRLRQEDVWGEPTPSCPVNTKEVAAIAGRNVEHTVMMHELSGSKRF